ELWKIVNKIPNLKTLIIETAFSNKERYLAEISRHLCPSMLAEELAKFEGRADIWITHLKPGEIELIMEEIEASVGPRRPRRRQKAQVFEFGSRAGAAPGEQSRRAPPEELSALEPLGALSADRRRELASAARVERAARGSDPLAGRTGPGQSVFLLR